MHCRRLVLLERIVAAGQVDELTIYKKYNETTLEVFSIHGVLPFIRF